MEDEVKILSIGNSFTQNAVKYLEEIVQSKGSQLRLNLACIPGGRLDQHADALSAFLKDPKGAAAKIYEEKKSSLYDIITREEWDYITIQQASFKSYDYETYMPHAKTLFDFLKKQSPKAEVVIHQTWAYRIDDELFNDVYSQKAMFEDLREAYERLSFDLGGLRIIPLGLAFQLVRESDEWNLKKDSLFDYEHASYPNVPKDEQSLCMGWKYNDAEEEKTFVYDGHHASANGEYLGGLIWFSFFYEEDPISVPFVPPEVKEEDALILKEKASLVYNEYIKR